MSDDLRDMVRRLQLIHEAMVRFERGGPQCAREIEQLYEKLVAVQDAADGLDSREEELDDRKAELAEREAIVRALMKMSWPRRRASHERA